MTRDVNDPADDLTINESTADFESKGYTAQLAAVEDGDGLVRCFACRTDSPATSFAIEAIERSEGASDPADMVAVVAVSCPNCGAKGTLTLKYGPESTLEDSQVLRLLDDQR